MQDFTVGHFVAFGYGYFTGFIMCTIFVALDEFINYFKRKHNEK